MGDRFENTVGVEIPELDDYARIVTKAGGTRRALVSELAKKIVEEYEGSTLGGEERTIQAAIADAKQVASEAIQEEQTAREEADTAITADLAKKAYADGEYADLHAGTANQILSDTYTTDEEPYHYRQTPSHAGTREIDEIVGGTVVWNQLCNGSSVTVQSDHKYIAKISGAFSIGVSTGTAITGLTSGTDMVIDLTAMFGSTIADHIYDLEQTTAGAGVAFFRKYFPDDYYAYDPGTMRSVEGLVSHVTTGFNQFDEEVEEGFFDQTTGAKTTSTTRYRSKNYIPILSSTTYYFKNSANAVSHSAVARFYFYDADKNFIEAPTGTPASRAFTTPSNARYMMFFVNEALANYGNDICINISNTAKNGTYEPYEKHSYPLDNSVTLRGIPQLVDGKLKWNGDIYPPSGLITRRYGIVDLGSLNYTQSGISTEGKYRFSSTTAPTNIKPTSSGTEAANCISIIGIGASMSQTYNGMEGISVSTDGRVSVFKDAYASMSATEFKAAMDGVMLIYELATPTTEQAEPYQSLQTCSPYGTEEYVSTSIVPVGHYTKYPTDLKGIVEKIADAPSADGTYTLKAVVSGGKVTYSWESA